MLRRAAASLDDMVAMTIAANVNVG
jgi:hypothetical protein